MAPLSQDVFYEFRDKTRHIADHHANLGRTIDSSIVQHLQKLRAEIKAHIKVSVYITERVRSVRAIGYDRTYKMILESWQPASQRNANCL